MFSLLTKIKRFLRLCSYLSRLEPRYFTCSSLFNIIKYSRPFVSLYLSKCIIDLIFMNTSLGEIMKYVWSMVLINLIMMIGEGYFQSRSQYHDFNMIRNHNMMKAKKLMNLDYEFVEKESLQDSIVELQYLEMTGVHNFASFGKALGNLCGSLVGFIISLYFSIEFFKADFSFRGLSNVTMDFIFITLFILFNTLSFRELSKANREAGKTTKESNGILRYTRSYMNIIYDYKTGKDVRLYDMDLAKNAGEKYKENMYYVYSSFWAKLGRGNTIAEILSSVLSVIIFMFVGMKALYGAISIGEIMLYIGAINNISKNSTEIVKSLSLIIPSDSYREKLFRFMDLNNLKENREVKVNKELYGKCEIEFKNVSFKYPDTDKYVLKNVSLKFKVGEKLAIVGINGSGKTTLIKLLLGLYEPTEGKITVNGKNIKSYNYDEYLNIFSVVFQDFKLFSLTLGENVATSTEYNEGEVKEALQKVGLSKFLDRNDLKTHLYREFDENGVEVSGGEAQKIAMARAIYKKGSFFVLDEPTAALDPISEHEIYSKFNTLIGDNTAVYISHRLSSCRFCDNICVLHEGRIVQYGAHEELVADTSGKYYELWSSQAKYYAS